MQGGGLRRGKSGRKRMTKVEAEGDLSPQQKAFANSYISSFDAGTAYAKAGYKVNDRKSAVAGGNRLLRMRKVAKYIELKLKEIRMY